MCVPGCVWGFVGISVESEDPNSVWGSCHFARDARCLWSVSWEAFIIRVDDFLNDWGFTIFEKTVYEFLTALTYVKHQLITALHQSM